MREKHTEAQVSFACVLQSVGSAGVCGLNSMETTPWRTSGAWTGSETPRRVRHGPCLERESIRSTPVPSVALFEIIFNWTYFLKLNYYFKRKL